LLLSGLLGIFKSSQMALAHQAIDKSESWWPNLMNKLLIQKNSERQRKIIVISYEC